MSYNAIVHLLQSSLDHRVSLGVHQFRVQNTVLQLSGDDTTVAVMVTPGTAFERHLRLVGNGFLCLSFKSNHPRNLAFTGFDARESLMFRDVRTPDDAPLLIKTLLLVVDFETRLRDMVCAMWDEYVDPVWTVVVHPSSAMDVEHEIGSVRLARADDSVHIFAEPLTGVFDPFIVWDGSSGLDGFRTGALTVGDAVFPGAQEENDTTVSFSYHFPDDEEELHTVMSALVWILHTHLTSH
jgi:hypothetical protein